MTARLWIAAPLCLALLPACDRPSESVRTNTSSNAIPVGPDAGRGASVPGSEASGGSASVPVGASPPPADGGAVACPPGRVAPPFEDGAWSVRSLVCARGTLNVGDRFVLRAMPTGGSDCHCPPNVACAPCMPYRLFRDAPGDAVFVTLRAQFPPGLVDGARVDVPVRLFEWGGPPPVALADLVWVP